MKRLTLLTILLVVVGLASGFALEVKPAFTLSGSASLAWGLNLDTMDTGFQNTASADFTVSLVADSSSDTHAGKGPVFGSITISDLELYWIDGLQYTGADVTGPLGAQPTISAKLVFGPFDLSIFDHPAMNSEGAPAIETAPDTGNAIVNAVLLAEPAFTFGAYNTNQGTYLRYNMGANWVQADLVSKDDWTGGTDSEYAVGAETSMVFAPVTVGLGLFQGINWTPANPLGGYATVAVDLTGIGSAKVGFDWQADFSPSAFTWDIFAQAQMNFNKDATAYLLAKIFYQPDVDNLDSSLYFIVPANTLFGPVNADLTFYAVDLTSTTADIAALAHLGYNFTLGNGMLVAPTVFVAFTSVGTTPAVNSLQIGPQVVVTLATAPTTTLALAYTSGDLLLATPGKGNIVATLTVTY